MRRCDIVILTLLIVVGCGHSDIRKPLVVSFHPEVLDFGQVRSSDSPILMSFEIENKCDTSLRITDIRSGCGCTIISVPDEQILPHKKLSIPLKVNLLGLSGDMKNIVNIWIGEGKCYTIDIIGKVVNDIWFSGQSVRCNFHRDDNIASGTFSVFTTDYPNIEFEMNDFEKGVFVGELSRLITDGLCEIKFTFRIQVDEGDVTDCIPKNIQLLPKEKDIAPLVIPVLCYRIDDSNLMPKLVTAQINLGTIYSGETSDIQIFGDPDILSAVTEVSLTGVPQGVTARPPRAVPNSKNALSIMLVLDESVLPGLFSGEMKLKTTGNREYPIPLYGLVVVGRSPTALAQEALSVLKAQVSDAISGENPESDHVDDQESD